MKVALSTTPQTAVQPYAQGTLDAPSPGTGGDGFAQMLAQMLSLSPAESRESSPATEIAPGLGASTQAFQNARMLVETALEHSRSEVGTAASERALPELPVLEKLASADAKNLDEASRSTAAISELSAVNFNLISAKNLTTGTVRAVAPAHSAPSFQLAMRALTQPPISISTANALRPANPDSGNVPPATVTQALPAALKQAEGGHSTPFSAQLLTTDSGLVLLLRLPKLASTERADLENSTVRLLQGLGLKRHQIVIQEITEGQG